MNMNVNELKEKPSEALLNYKPKELRHAANWIDRDNGSHQIINAVTLFRKLEEMSAEITIGPRGSGFISFNVNNKRVIRYFESANEMSTAMNLGPLNLNDKENLYFKADSGASKCYVTMKMYNKNMIQIFVPELNIYKDIYLNGAEKILCNNAEGLTAGQIKLLEIQ